MLLQRPKGFEADEDGPLPLVHREFLDFQPSHHPADQLRDAVIDVLEIAQQRVTLSILEYRVRDCLFNNAGPRAVLSFVHFGVRFPLAPQ
jgi:hypothetical protein